jgi:hypothetical protein
MRDSKVWHPETVGPEPRFKSLHAPILSCHFITAEGLLAENGGPKRFLYGVEGCAIVFVGFMHSIAAPLTSSTNIVPAKARCVTMTQSESLSYYTKYRLAITVGNHNSGLLACSALAQCRRGWLLPFFFSLSLTLELKLPSTFAFDMA